jgi:hypothetical protein
VVAARPTGCKRSYRAGPSLNAAELADLVLSVGSPDPVRQVAIALAESEGRYRAWCDNYPTEGTPFETRDRGLWQLNSHWFRTVSDDEAYDPGVAAWYVARYAERSGWSPWSRSNTGPTTPAATAAVAAVRAEVAAGKSLGKAPTLTADGRPRVGTWVRGAAGRAAAGAGASRPPAPAGIAAPAGFDIPNPIDILTGGIGSALPISPLDLLDPYDIVPGNPLGALEDVGQTAAAAVRLAAKVVGILISPAFWRRAGLVLAAVAVLALGVVIILRETTLRTIRPAAAATDESE